MVSIIYKTVGMWKENAYLLKNGNEAWLVDPGDAFEELDEAFSKEGLSYKGIINTHAHFDHIGAVEGFKTKYNIPFYLHQKDRQLVRQGNLYRKLAGSATTFITPSIDGFLEPGATLNLGGSTITVHFTPGHTHGSVCFEVGDALISGDLLFKDSLGRIDLPGGDRGLLQQSVNFVLERFAGFTIYPGHGQPFTLTPQTISLLRNLL